MAKKSDKQLIRRAIRYAIDYRLWYIDCYSGCHDEESDNIREEENKFINECKDLLSRL